MSGLELMGRSAPGLPGVPVAEGERTRRRFEVSGRRAGRRLPAVRLRHRLRAGADRPRVEHRRRGGGRGRGRPGGGGRVRAPAGRRRRRRWPWSSGVHETDAARRSAAPASRSSASERRRRAGTLASPDVAICDGLPGRAARPGRPALPAPVHHLHQLRPPVHDHHRAALRPRHHHDGRLRDVRRLPGRVRRPGRPPLPRPADRLPGLRADRLELVGPAASHEAGDGAVRAARDLLAAGRVVAVKGLGGYHLACDARNEAAVAELRRRKQRGDKPFAVMVRDLDVAAAAGATIGDEERRCSPAPAGPIVLLPADRRPRRRSPPSVAPGNPDLGLMLPYTPLHVLLLGSTATRHRRAGDDVRQPVRRADRHRRRRGARAGSAPLADAWLRHDRPIHVPCDDSVARFVAGAELPVRRSRGYAPLPLALPFEVDAGAGRRRRPEEHLRGGRGPLRLGQPAHRRPGRPRHPRRAGRAPSGTSRSSPGVRPGVLVADAHPGYRSSAWAREHAGRPAGAHRAAPPRAHRLGDGRARARPRRHGHRVRLRRHRLRHRRRGLGRRGARRRLQVVPAGRAPRLRAAGRRRRERAAPLPDGAGAPAVGRRRRGPTTCPPVAACPERERGVLAHQLDTGLGCVPTSSMGRLFDAVASLVGVRHTVDYEAQAAIELEALARSCADPAPVRVRPRRGREGPAGVLVADPGPVSAPSWPTSPRASRPRVVAARFHAGGRGAGRRPRGARARGGPAWTWWRSAAACSRTRCCWRPAQRHAGGARVHRPAAPAASPNDGGIALGQILVGSLG